MRRANVLTDACEYDDADPPGYRSSVKHITRSIGGEALAVKVFELPAGQALCPYHYEYEEEWLVVLDGDVTLRTPAGEHQLERGEAVCFPPGPEGAHKVSNQTRQTARVMMFSSAREPALAVYPDSDKLGVWAPGGEDNVMLRRADGSVDYWDGERQP